MKKVYSFILLEILMILSLLFSIHLHALAAPPQNHLDFDGVDDRVVTGDSISLDITDAISVEAWIRSDTISDMYGQARIISKNIDYEITVHTQDTGCGFWHGW